MDPPWGLCGSASRLSGASLMLQLELALCICLMTQSCSSLTLVVLLCAATDLAVQVRI
jgi:hypothetical protein